MQSSRSWVSYPPDYRAREMGVLAGWVQAGVSGAVVGPAGVGKSNLLGYLAHRPDAFQTYLPAGTEAPALIPVDLNNLPAADLGTFYRVILRAFYESRAQLEENLAAAVAGLYLDNKDKRDPFLSQSALRELLLAFRGQGRRVVLILDTFDRFIESAEPQMTDTLRGLRDSFKDTLSYIVDLGRDVVYLADRATLGDLYELLDTYVCHVQPMGPADADFLIANQTRHSQRRADRRTVERMVALSGGYPSILKSLCHWWLALKDGVDLGPAEDLLGSSTIRVRLERLWDSLTLAEQGTLSELAVTDEAWPVNGRSAAQSADQTQEALARLRVKGLVKESGAIGSELLAAYARSVAGDRAGTLWFEADTSEPYLGRRPLEGLSPLEHKLLRFLVGHPRARHTHSDLIDAVWPAEVSKEGVSNEALYQVVRGLRRKVEPDPSRPRFIINWRGTPEGGYQCFPEGRPV